ncbi:MAG: TlyA family RNA methyltransferase [Oscillospiraceae bacterium]|jgi:23S rRNA (cytidine1920-2'-O)/16S rRNA (cytidine1409-2'-O)-methyltransferase|nr:TlyA family RNA methyltransferase [Oscillospiraceae bacterium]
MSIKSLDIFESEKFVSRGGQKLEKALEYFDVSVENKVCIDSGASTGGFTDCLLKRNAKKVYAVDVGYGQLAWTLRNNPRVVVLERTNIRYVTSEMLQEKLEIATLDLSFISLALVLPVMHNLGAAEVICLIKPQFEAGKGNVGKKGIVRDPKTHIDVLDAFIQNATNAGYYTKGLTYSPVKGPKGNIEFLGYLTEQENTLNINTKALVEEAHSVLDVK